MGRIATIVLIVTALADSIAAQPTAPPGQDSLYLKNPTYHRQIAFWNIYPAQKADVVMLGNSITQGVNWSELLELPLVLNRGISGDNTNGFLQRMQYVTRHRPTLCFIMGGINDLYAGYTVDQVYANYIKVIDTLQLWLITPVVQSTLYVSPRWRDAEAKNQLVKELNRRLEEYCLGGGLEYLDVNARLSDGTFLRDEYTTEGLHLNPLAYTVWGELVKQHLVKFGIKRP